jgi:hypothetical protein
MNVSLARAILLRPQRPVSLRAVGIFAFANRAAFRRENIFFSPLNDRCAASHKTQSGHVCRNTASALRKNRAERLFMGLQRPFQVLLEGRFCASRHVGVADRRYAMAVA